MGIIIPGCLRWWNRDGFRPYAKKWVARRDVFLDEVQITAAGEGEVSGSEGLNVGWVQNCLGLDVHFKNAWEPQQKQRLQGHRYQPGQSDRGLQKLMRSLSPALACVSSPAKRPFTSSWTRRLTGETATSYQFRAEKLGNLRTSRTVEEAPDMVFECCLLAFACRSGEPRRTGHCSWSAP